MRPQNGRNLWRRPIAPRSRSRWAGQLEGALPGQLKSLLPGPASSCNCGRGACLLGSTGTLFWRTTCRRPHSRPLALWSPLPSRRPRRGRHLICHHGTNSATCTAFHACTTFCASTTVCACPAVHASAAIRSDESRSADTEHICDDRRFAAPGWDNEDKKLEGENAEEEAPRWAGKPEWYQIGCLGRS